MWNPDVAAHPNNTKRWRGGSWGSVVSQSSSMSEPQTLVRDTVSKTKACFSQDKVSLCGPGWSQTHRDPPALAFQVPGLQGCAIMAEEWQWDREDGVHLRTLVRQELGPG